MIIVGQEPKPEVIIYHANCPDGWGSAWWLAKNHPTPTIRHGANHGELPPLDLVRGRDVWLVDFCYPGPELAELADVANCVTILDHHQSTEGYLADANVAAYSNVDEFYDMADLGGLNRVTGVLDQSRSGVGLVGQYVKRRTGIMPPPFLSNIEDRDLWRFKIDSTKDVFAAVTSVPYADEAWDRLEHTPLPHLVEQGQAINRYRDRLIEQVAASTFTLHLGGLDIPCASSPYAIGSDVAGFLAEKNPEGVGAYVILHADSVQVGLRSRGDGPDVASLAERFGGGGHKHASGLRLAWLGFNFAPKEAP